MPRPNASDWHLRHLVGRKRYIGGFFLGAMALLAHFSQLGSIQPGRGEHWHYPHFHRDFVKKFGPFLGSKKVLLTR